MKLQHCRICKHEHLSTVISLGNQKITSIFKKYGEHEIESYPVNLCMCEQCGLVQLEETTPPDDMYKTNNYGYLSSISNTMRTHLKAYNDEILEKIPLKEGDVVVDIGSNDATFLHYYDDNLRRVGVDPTGNQFRKFYHDLELIPDYFTRENVIGNLGNLTCKVVTSICMFYDLPDPVQFAKDIHDMLDDEGIWTCEQSYLPEMLKTNSLDTICHEHLEYYALTQIVDIANRANLKIIDVKFNSSNGGSFRIYFAKQTSTQFEECTSLIDEILAEENRHHIKDKQTYIDFVKKCDGELRKLTDMIACINENGKKAYIYGASTKGNCILQYCNITEDKVKYAVERNPEKIGLSTNTGIEIIDEETMRRAKPDYLIVLPWHFKNEIIRREEEYLDKGGQLIFYFPTFEIVSSKPKLLLTGCDGFIASYVKEQYNDYMLYGITKTKRTLEDNITKFFMDMRNRDKLEQVIQTIQPDSIVHLAGMSSSVDAFHDPIQSLEANGMITANLCDIIHRTNPQIKLFNASSSEVYKGHEEFTVDEYENMEHTSHLHPYSIAKIMGQEMVRFYRETYQLHFSNGVLFTTQSARKSDKFLLNKIAKHIGKTGDAPITVGSLDSYRNMIHPSDVAFAIKHIIHHDKGDDYTICNYDSCKIEDVVLKLYQTFNIELVPGDEPNTYYDKETKQPLLIIGKATGGLDTKCIHIKGYPHKLKELGWSIRYSIDDILQEYV